MNFSDKYKDIEEFQFIDIALKLLRNEGYVTRSEHLFFDIPRKYLKTKNGVGSVLDNPPNLLSEEFRLQFLHDVLEMRREKLEHKMSIYVPLDGNLDMSFSSQVAQNIRLADWLKKLPDIYPTHSKPLK